MNEVVESWTGYTTDFLQFFNDLNHNKIQVTSMTSGNQADLLNLKTRIEKSGYLSNYYAFLIVSGMKGIWKKEYANEYEKFRSIFEEALQQPDPYKWILKTLSATPVTGAIPKTRVESPAPASGWYLHKTVSGTVFNDVVPQI